MANITEVSIRGEVKVTVSIAVEDATEIKTPTMHKAIMPERVIVSYTYTPAAFDPEGRVYFVREISVQGRYVLKSGALGKDVHTTQFYSWDYREGVPQWVIDLADWHRPDWGALVMPEMLNPTD